MSLVSKGQNSADQVGGDHDLLSGGIPGAGIVIGEFLKLGGTWAYQLGLHGTFQGALNLGITFQAGMKDMSALLTLDGVKPTKSFAKGWDKFKFPEPQYQLRQVEHNTEMSAVAQASIEFGVEAIKVGELHFKVAIPLPELSIKFNVGEGEFLSFSKFCFKILIQLSS